MQDATVNIVRGSRMAKGSRRNWALIGGGVAACAACCAPLLAPLFVGAGSAGVAGAAAGSLFGLAWREVACVGIIAALVVGVLFLVWRSISRRRQAAACACESADGASCDVGGTCDSNATLR